ncbi:MAG: ribosome silencing factor [Phycisphaerales bacterium]
MPTTQTDAREFAVEVAQLMSDLKCEDVIVLDVRGLSQVTNFVIIGTGTSERQMRSVGEDIGELGQDHGHDVFRANQDRSSNWVIVDFVDVTAHLFEPNSRAFYDLEHLWADAPRIQWRRERPSRASKRDDDAGPAQPDA